MAEHKIIPSPHKGIDLSVKEQYLSPEMRYAADIVNMISTKQSTLRKRAGYRYFDSEPEGFIPLDLFEFGAITEDGLTPLVMTVGHQEIRIISALVLFPDNFTATPGAMQVLLSWSEVEDATYELQYKLTADDWDEATETTTVMDITTLSYTATGLMNDSEYQFRIRAVIDGVNSKWKTITATPSGFTAAPGVPTNLRETIGETSFTPMWDPSSQALDYEVRYREVGTTPYTTVSNIMGTSHEITGLSSGTDYEWQVRARNAFNTESFSARVPATPRQVTTQAIRWFVAARREETIALGRPNNYQSNHIDWVDSSIADTTLSPSLLEGGETNIRVTSFVVSNSLAPAPGMALWLQPGDAHLISQWESSEKALRVTIGSNSLTTPGPTFSGSYISDDSEPYGWRLPVAVQAEVRAFLAAVSILSQAELDMATLTFLWSGRIFKSSDSGNTWNGGTDAPVEPAGFVVDSSGVWTLLGTNNMIYEKGAGAWGQPQSGPAGVTGFTGIDKDEDGNIYTVSNVTNRFYQRTGITWNTGIVLPPTATDSQGISVDSGNIYVLDAGSRKYYTYSNSSWDVGTDLPAAATSPTGIKVRDGIVYIVDDATNEVYKRESGTWDSGTAIASGASSPAGFAISGASLT